MSPSVRTILTFTLFACCSPLFASTLYTNAKVYTVEQGLPWAEEFAEAGGKITCVGMAGDCKAGASHTVDLGGLFVLPGFIDSHNHIRYAMGNRFLSVSDATSRAEFREMIQAHAMRYPELEWIVGDGWNYSIFEGGMPTYRDVAGLGAGRPILLTSYDAHTQLLNRAAMDAFGITRDTQSTPLGTIVRNAEGEPTGVFKAALYLSDEDFEAIYEVMPEPDVEDMYRSFIGNLEEAAANGLTTIVEPQMYVEDIEFFERARSEGKLNAHIRLALFHPPNTDRGTLALYKDVQQEYRKDPQIRVPALKLYIDDVIESETAALFEPYVGSDNTGELFYGPEAFDKLVTRLDAEGFQLFIHAIGDRGIRTALDALETARAANGAPRLPHQLIHVELIKPQDMARFAELDVSAVIQPRHMSPDVALQWAKSVGPERLPHAWPMRSLLDAGARLAFSSDWNVAEMNVMYGVYSAVTRLGLSGQPEGGWQPQERITVADALYAYTLGGALTNGIAKTRGSIKAGKAADFVVLDANPFDIAPEKLKDVRVIQTVFEGRTVYTVSP